MIDEKDIQILEFLNTYTGIVDVSHDNLPIKMKTQFTRVFNDPDSLYYRLAQLKNSDLVKGDRNKWEITEQGKAVLKNQEPDLSEDLANLYPLQNANPYRTTKRRTPFQKVISWMTSSTEKIIIEVIAGVLIFLIIYWLGFRQ